MKRKRKRKRTIQVAEHRFNSAKEGAVFTEIFPHKVASKDKRRLQSVRTELSVNMQHLIDFDADTANLPESARRIFDGYHQDVLADVVSPDFKYRAAAIYHTARLNVPSVMSRLEMMPFTFTWVEETSYIRLWMLAEWQDRDIFYMRWKPSKGSLIPVIKGSTLTLTSEMHLPDKGFWHNSVIFDDIAPMNHRNFCQFAEGCVNNLIRISAQDIGGTFDVLPHSDRRWLGEIPYTEVKGA